MKKRGDWIVAMLTAWACTGTAWGADRIVGIVPANGATCFAKRFEVAAGTTITGLQFENNDGSTTFPEVALYRGPLTTIAEGALLASASQVRVGAGVATIAWAEPISVASAGTYYAVIRFPAGPGRQGPGRGPGLGAGDLAAPNGSYVTGGVNDALIATKVDLRIALVTTAGKAVEELPQEPPAETTSLADRLIVKQGHHESSASIRFELAAPSDVVLSVYDVSGRLLSEIVRAPFPAGTHEQRWEDARDGRRIPAGVYLVRLDTGRRTLVEKLIIAP